LAASVSKSAMVCFRARLSVALAVAAAVVAWCGRRMLYPASVTSALAIDCQIPLALSGTSISLSAT
jgi:hypothetical protein